jgi:hypothetical protein
MNDCPNIIIHFLVNIVQDKNTLITYQPNTKTKYRHHNLKNSCSDIIFTPVTRLKNECKKSKVLEVQNIRSKSNGKYKK